MPHHPPPNISATSTSACASCHQQPYSTPSIVVRSLPPFHVSCPIWSSHIYLVPPPPTRVTCATTDPTQPPCKIYKTPLLPRVLKLITCSPDKNYVWYKMFVVLPHLPMLSLGPCTPTSLAPSLPARSKVCSTYLLHKSMISTQLLSTP